MAISSRVVAVTIAAALSSSCLVAPAWADSLFAGSSGSGSSLGGDGSVIVDLESDNDEDAFAGSVVVDGVTLTTHEAQVIADLNGYRVSKGLKPLRVDKQLTVQSRYWSEELVARNVGMNLIHSDMNVFENVAMSGFKSGYKDFFQMWQKSPGHNRNMLEPTVTRVGYGIAQAPNGNWYGTMQLMWDEPTI